MCELLTLSAKEPATVNLSFSEFARHGGATGHHADGWGIGFYSGHRVQLMVEASPAADSELARFIGSTRQASHIAVAHIRKATQGAIQLANTQPFARNIAGRDHVFAHNGDLHDIHGFDLGFHRPIGDTDSELAFCVLLARLEEVWRGRTPPTLRERVDVVARFARELVPKGILNFIYCDGDYTFAHGHKRTNPVTEQVEPPGLHMLCRHCQAPKVLVCEGGVVISSDYCDQEVTILASVPLTGESWEPLAEGELVVLERGHVVDRVRTI